MSDVNEDAALKKLQTAFKHSGFKSDEQKNAILNVLRGVSDTCVSDTYVALPTGTGKSMCYLLPGTMQEDKMTIVITPNLALIKNQADYLKPLNIPTIIIDSKLKEKERNQIMDDLKASKTTTKFLYLTSLYAAKPKVIEFLQDLALKNKIAFIALDEAHCISQWSHDYKDKYAQFAKLRGDFPKVPWIAVTGTAPKRVKDDVIQHLKEPVQCFESSCFRNNLFYEVIRDKDFNKLGTFINNCLRTDDDIESSGREKPCGIIYCRERVTTESVVKELTTLGIKCAAYHSGIKQNQRDQIQDNWMNGDVPVIVALISFGMGIDKGPVRFVIHWDVPQCAAEWYQESGRAGRDGNESYCRLYFDGRENVKPTVKRMKLFKNSTLEIANLQNDDFEKFMDFLETPACCHKFFADFFGDSAPSCIDMCIFCKKTESLKSPEALLNPKIPKISPVNYEIGENSGLNKETRRTQKGKPFAEISKNVV